MIPAREDLIRVLERVPQLGLAQLVAEFACDQMAILRTLKTGDDFEPVAPRPQDGQGFAWRLSSLASDPRVRNAALKNQRDIEQPPQARRFAVTSHRGGAHGADHANAGVLVAWLTQNPGEWTIAQIAHSRGTTPVTVREHVRRCRHLLATRRGTTEGRPLLIQLKPHA